MPAGKRPWVNARFVERLAAMGWPEASVQERFADVP